MIAKTVQVYHTMKYDFVLQTDFLTANLYIFYSSILFSDSKIAVKNTIERTKAAATAHNVLKPNFLEHHISCLKNDIFEHIV